MKPITVLINLCFFLFLIALSVSCHRSSGKTASASQEGKMFVNAVAFQTDSGWGYKIYVDDKLYIKQAVIPGLPGRHSFMNQEDALKTGKLVIDKMAATHTMPFVSQQELQQLHIRMPD